jgi:hypothetical protein
MEQIECSETSANKNQTPGKHPKDSILKRMVKAIHSWQPISKRPTGRPKTSWKNDVKKDIQKLIVPNWRTPVQDGRRWKEMV